MTTDNPELKKILSFFIDDDGNGNINANKYFALVSKAGTARTSSNAENIVQTEFLNLLGLAKANSPITEESLSFIEKRMAEYEFLASGKKSSAEYDATKLSHPINVPKLISEETSTRIHADGEYVGLPEGQMGNSEVGHLNLGAEIGRAHV